MLFCLVYLIESYRSVSMWLEHHLPQDPSADRPLLACASGTFYRSLPGPLMPLAHDTTAIWIHIYCPD